MKQSLMATLAASLLLSTAVPVMSQPVTDPAVVNSELGVSVTTQDFITRAAIGGMFEIETSRLALDRAPDAATKAFAQQMISDHTKISDELKKLITTEKLKAILPTELDTAHQEKLDRLKALSGKHFSDAYHEVQVDAHENAVALFKRYATDGDVAALKTWAGSTLPMLEHHLKMAQELAK